MSTLPSISFCVTCRNRWYQLKQTLPRNLAILKHHELVVVNYGSHDEIDVEMQAYRAEMAAGTLRYFHTPDPQAYDCSKAKNLAHRLGSKEFLFNLDGDNFLTPEFIAELETQFARHPYAVVHAFDAGNYVAGTHGRIGVHRDNYYAVGGYNEGFLPMGFQDDDFILRLNLLGLPYIQAAEAAAAAPPPIFNSIDQKGNESSNGGGAAAYYEFRDSNCRLSFARLAHVGPVLEQNFASFQGRLNYGEPSLVDGYVAPVRPRLPPSAQAFAAPQFQSRILRYYRQVRQQREQGVLAFFRKLLRNRGGRIAL